MELKDITVTEISAAVTVYSEKGTATVMKDRKSYGLSLCIDGQITYIQNGREYLSHKGCAVVLPKGATYTVRREKTGCFPVINFNCLEFLCDTVTVIPLQNAEELLADYERLKRHLTSPDSRAQAFSIFYDMISKLSPDPVPRELSGAIRLIESSFKDSSLTNERLACECKMSEVYFRKLFKKHFGISPRQYIIDVRLRMAKELLTEKTSSIESVAERCGFSNPYHFARIFKEHTGTTPTKYRKANQTHEI